MQEKYLAIIDYEYTGVKGHIPMSRLDRAAQFAAFAALTGHDQCIKDTEEANRQYQENLHRGMDLDLEIC